MKANSNDSPGKFTKSRGKVFFNFNIIESEKTDEQDTRTVFDYEYVEIKNEDRVSIIQAIMRDKYTVDDEVALINNKFRSGTSEDLEYDNYQAFRVLAKSFVDGFT